MRCEVRAIDMPRPKRIAKRFQEVDFFCRRLFPKAKKVFVGCFQLEVSDIAALELDADIGRCSQQPGKNPVRRDKEIGDDLARRLSHPDFFQDGCRYILSRAFLEKFHKILLDVRREQGSVRIAFALLFPIFLILDFLDKRSDCRL